MNIGRKDIYWNYLATFLKIAASAILLPFILRMMSSETVGIWTVFSTISSLIVLFDFGFNPSFARNVTYVFSGVTSLKPQGFHSVNIEDKIIVDFQLLKGLIISMRWFYFRVALVLFLLLISVGTYYVHYLIINYKGNHQEVYIAWILLCLISTYNLYTMYYESLLLGKGLVMRSKQIVIVGQTVYLSIAILLIYNGYGLIAIVLAQVLSVIIVRIMSYKTFYNVEIRNNLNSVESVSTQEILKSIYPNALKLGLTGIGSFLVSRSSIIIGSLFLNLSEIASYGISVQFITVISALAGIYLATYMPTISHLRVLNQIEKIREIYIRGELVLIFSFFFGGVGLLITGEWLLNQIGSNTHLVSPSILFITLIVTFLEANHSAAGTLLVTKNEVPFFRASLLSGAFTVCLLLLFLYVFKLSVISLVLAPGIAQIVYQNWKWPLEVKRDLGISVRNLLPTFLKVIRI